jgi:hypothetical protein
MPYTFKNTYKYCTRIHVTCVRAQYEEAVDVRSNVLALCELIFGQWLTEDEKPMQLTFKHTTTSFQIRMKFVSKKYNNTLVQLQREFM